MSVYSQNLTFFGSSSGEDEITSTLPCFDATATASGVPEGYVIDNVTINITHTWDSDLDIYIISPGGTEIELSTDNGSLGDNYTDTEFRADAATSITDGSPPFTGSFMPEGDLGAADGQNFNGDWILRVCDDTSGDTGTLNSWSITFAPGPDCEAAIVSGELVEDCDNNQYFINILVTKKGDGTEINYGMPITSTPMPEDGQSVQLGPFPSGVSTTVVISHDNGEDPDPLGSACNYELGTFSASCPPPNDSCPDALSLSCGDSAFGDTTAASNVGAPTGFCGTTPGSKGVWYLLTGTGGDVTVSTDNAGTNYDTKLNVYSNICGDLVCVGGNDDGGTGLTSEFTFGTTAGDNYYIYVNGFLSNSGNFELTVSCALTADIADDCNTVYAGYDAAACVDLTVDSQFGVAPLSYLWSNGDTTATINVCPTETTTYSVTVTDAAGSTAGDSTVVVVVDAGCDTPGNEDKVEVCHKGNTICVSASAVQAHLNHGDSLGACEGTFTCDTAPDCSVVTNPADGAVDVSNGTQIEWSTAPGYVEGYRISIGTTSGGTDVVNNEDVGLTNSYDPGTLAFSTTYYVNVTAYNGNGDSSGCAESSFTTVADPCTLATPIGCNSTVFGNTVGASTADLDFCGTSLTSAGGVWYEFIGTGDDVAVTTCSPNTNYDTKLGVFTGDCDSLVCVGGDDDDFDCEHSIRHSLVEFSSVAGQVYKIYVTGFSTFEGDFELTLTCTTPPVPPCENAEQVFCGSVVNGSTDGVDGVDFDSTCFMSDFGRWYKFVGDGQTWNISATTSNYDIEMSITSGECPDNLTNIACVDSAFSSGTESTSVPTVDGTTYFIYIAHWSSSSSTTGSYTLSITCEETPSPPCDSAEAVSCGSVVNGSTDGVDGVDFDSTCTMSDYGRWYKFEGDGGSYDISATTSGYDIEMSISSGDCPNLTNVACRDTAFSSGTESYTLNSTAGTTYYIYIAHWSSSSSTTGSYTLEITCTGGTIANPIGNGETISWGMSPNPSIGVVNVDLKNFLNTDVTIDVLDFTGKVLSTLRLEDIQNPRYRMQLSETLTNGMYMVRLSSDLQSSAKRLILNR
ncbi:MAG: T9SS type A sorting domain-containing protein, partial [Flavobacteriaceae bacterium]|nr:T9SS type A sorting domain-containing protein [Flavobacteriaceae bacterium]